MGKIDLLLDTNVLIEIWRRKKEPVEAIEGLKCGIDTIACGEFLQGVNFRQREQAEELLSKFDFIPFSSAVSYRALDLLRKFSHEKGLRMPDSLVASTAIERDVPLFTYNKKHFNFIDELRLV